MNILKWCAQLYISSLFILFISMESNGITNLFRRRCTSTSCARKNLWSDRIILHIVSKPFIAPRPNATNMFRVCYIVQFKRRASMHSRMRLMMLLLYSKCIPYHVDNILFSPILIDRTINLDFLSIFLPLFSHGALMLHSTLVYDISIGEPF